MGWKIRYPYPSNRGCKLKFTELSLHGAYLVEPEFIEDERGFFARSFCTQEFKKQGLNTQLEQCNISYNIQKGTLRGMHYQINEKSEAKLVRCSMGSIYDVLIDLRPASSTFKKWIALELSAKNRKMVFIPEGFAHGFQTLEDEVEVFYQMSNSFDPKYARGIRWNDPAFKIQWPHPEPTLISTKDQQHPNF